MNKEQLRMQMLAGIITESQYKEKMEENQKPFQVKIYNKNGTTSTQTINANPGTTELFDIINLIQQSPRVKKVEVLEDDKK
jgi:hypothetical protein